MNNSEIKNILVATDFLPASEAAFQQAVWFARQNQARITLIHALPDLRKELLAASPAAQRDAVLGEGDLFQQEIREESFARLHHVVDKLHAKDLDIHCQVLLGDPSIATIQAAQKGQHDLVLIGTRGNAAWEHFIMGSTAKRLIRKCPSLVWAVKEGTTVPPRSILAATDLSPVGNRALQQACRLAKTTNAKLHVIYVLDTNNLPDAALERMPSGWQLRESFRTASQDLLDRILSDCGGKDLDVSTRVSWAVPTSEIAWQAVEVKADLLVVGTIGRSGIKGLVLGNTAERLLDQCRCSILAVKPEDYVSPIGVPVEL